MNLEILEEYYALFYHDLRSISVAPEKMSVIVTTVLGSLQGKECYTAKGKKYYCFEGIPYAKPPIGALRFQDPQDPEPWTGIRDATKPGNKCIQIDPSSMKSINGSEDCLYLNVYTPSLPDEKIENLPIIFFVHGGRLLVGFGDYYRPDYLIENDVILVTINYRLHVLGFLSLHIPEVPGNASFKDTVKSLKWVKYNIKYFNGDPNNVTAFGESAGAGLVTSYLTTKMADGLVNKIIAQSGTCLSDLLMIEEDPIEKAKHIASILGKEFSDIKSLHQFLLYAPIEDLLFAASVAEVSRPPEIINAYFLPVIEKRYEGIENFFVEYPLVTIMQNRHKKLPVIVGLSTHEGALFLRKNHEGKIDFLTDTQMFIPRYLSLKRDSPKSKKFGAQLHEFYFKNKHINSDTNKEYIDFVSDAYFNRDVILFAELFSKFGGEIYFYNFAYAGNMNTRVMKKLGLNGTTHGDIIQYQFYKRNKADQCNAKDKEVISNLSEAWCNFAKSGKPTWSHHNVKWLPYTQQSRLCLNINDRLTIIECPYWSRIKFWIDNMGERSKL